jgi:hypothetical protein
MKNNFILCLIALILIPNLLFGQKFKLETGVGASQIFWHEQQMTIDFKANVTFQKPGSSKLFFLALNTLGNISSSTVDKSTYSFIVPDNYTNSLDGDLFAAYRGGMAELGLKFNQTAGKKKAYLYPLLSLYSKSIARKISANKTEYVEEEKTSLHGITAGLGLKIPGETVVTLEGQLFQPLIGNIILYGRYIGVPYETTSQKNDLSYRAKLNLKYNKFGFSLIYELLNLSSAANNKSKSINASQAGFISTYLSYHF